MDAEKPSGEGDPRRRGRTIGKRNDGKKRRFEMRVIVCGLALIGLMVVLLFLAALGLFAFDEFKRRMEAEAPESATGDADADAGTA